MSEIRTRFAPSPTGHVHIGNIRAAIFNWLFARHTGGRFLLRIEDTDRERSTPEACRTLIEAMEWLGLNWDEPPLYQSARREAHLAAAERLLAAGHAYREDKGGTGRGECIVFRMPGCDIEFDDLVKGRLRKAAADLRDFVIVRSDGHPVFHLANVLDDIEMRVTHVIRGDDHVENTFRHIALFRALGAPVPRYAHLPMIVNAQGKPYSKRDGAAYVGEFRDRGILPDALFNYLALLGWSPGDGRELMSRAELIEAFSFERVQPSPAQFDLTKLLWMNGEYMRRLPAAERIEGHLRDLRAHGLNPDPADLLRVLEVMQDRIKVFSDTAAQTRYFFSEDYPVDEAAWRKRVVREGIPAALDVLRRRWAQLPHWSAAPLEAELKSVAAEVQRPAADLIHAVRIAVSGTPAGPGLFAMLEVLGRERVLARLQRAIARADAAASR
ncbi:MAG: glutamate--tRNA ligase [Kiritimatiellae bacterium]|nr:glutamate--tRNA ligase [Kiritimatiellia bacterium]